MIGQLINKFDASPEEKCNVGTFNEMFGNLLDDDNETSIEIGDIITGGRREILVGNAPRIVELRDIKEPIEKASLYNFDYRYEIDLAGETIKFDSLAEMGETLGFSANWLSQKFSKFDKSKKSVEIEHLGHIVRKIIAKKTVKKCLVKKEKVVRSEISKVYFKNKAYYTLTSPEGVAACYKDIYDILKHFKVSHKSFMLKMDENRCGDFRGYNITYTLFTKDQKKRITKLMKDGFNGKN
jgi:hypothetical protein